MEALFNSALFWIAIAVFAVVAVVIVNVVFRTISNQQASERDCYPHRVANELPRTLHKADHDEVLDLANEGRAK
jgi:hypothetical protein